MAGLWGLAEAILFFIVPDVFLSRIALDRPALAYRACVAALLGALAGGALMFHLGAMDIEALRSVLDRVPGIRSDMLAGVRDELERDGLLGLFTGPTRGVPYKLYAVEWGARGGALVPFLAMSVPARLLRFLAVTWAWSFAARRWLSEKPPAARRRVHLVFWTLFYALYFTAMRG